MAWAHAKDDAILFLKSFVYTMDEHDEKDPVKRFRVIEPIEVIAKLWQDLPANEHIVINKSRQLMCSWLAVAMVMWECLRKPGRLWGIVSKKEDDAAKLIGETRMGLCYHYLPSWMKNEHRLRPTEVRNTFEHPNGPVSQVMAMPQGSNQARMHTFSGMVFDEAAFQDALGQTIVGAKPTLHGGGKLILISSPAPGEFQSIFEGRWSA
ncbi:MAG: hypothetical protein GY937_19980 [bacterium]|nr:hypothetical protein [bacterium]